MNLRRHAVRAAVLATLAAGLALPASAMAKSAALPQGWPSASLQLGMRDDEGGATALRDSTKLGIRYHYLSGGVNTGSGWSTWAQGGGSFVSGFIKDSADHGFLPVFSYYQMRESAPGNSSDEESGMLNNLKDRAVMQAYYADLRLFFQKAAETGTETVLQVEPDLWGYVERHENGGGGDPSTVPASVGSSGISELAGLPDNAAGFAQAVVRLRDRYAKNVMLGYHLSVWGTGEDISTSDPSDAHVDELASQASSFYTALHANFDLVFAEHANRDAAYQQSGGDTGGGAWWTDADYARSARFLGDVASTVGKRIVLWQLPLGNTAMSAMNNTPGHYQDNHVQWLLSGAAGRAHMQDYVNAGVIAFLFGPALPDATCACDAKGDGVTNPAPINGNALASTSTDDDGGLFRSLANAYYTGGPIPLPDAKVSGGGKAKKTSAKAKFTIRTTSSKAVRRGRTARAVVRVRASSGTRAVVAVQFYAPNAGNTPTGQVAYRGQALKAGKTKSYTARFKIPSGAPAGTWRVKVGVFDVDFKKLQSWSPNAGAFRVR